jgi:hypothetical protein
VLGESRRFHGRTGHWHAWSLDPECDKVTCNSNERLMRKR